MRWRQWRLRTGMAATTTCDKLQIRSRDEWEVDHDYRLCCPWYCNESGVFLLGGGGIGLCLDAVVDQSPSLGSDERGAKQHFSRARCAGIIQLHVFLGARGAFRTRSGGHRRASRQTVFVFSETAATEIYTLSLHDALPGG